MGQLCKLQNDYAEALAYFHDFLENSDTSGIENETRKKRMVFLRDLANQSIDHIKKEMFFDDAQ
jgi:hypothetical protein